MNLKIKDIVLATKAKLICGNDETECENFSTDTRKINKNDVYIGIKGENFDGNLFWKNAFENGASTVIINKIDISKQELEHFKDKNILQVDDTKQALKQIATAKRNLYKELIVVGVTGSVGKTSTKDLIANVLSQKYLTLKTEGNNNNAIGLPLTILKLRNHEVAVIEMGMNHLKEISELSKIAKPTISIITNVGTSHIGNLKSRENILKAKLEILDGMENKQIIINNDNDLLHKWNLENKDIKKYTFGINNTSDCMAKNIIMGEDGSSFECNIENKKINEIVPVGGKVFVLNALCASLVGKKLGLTNEEIKKGISEFELTKKRMEIIRLKNNITIINDSYNASFESMKAAIEYLASLSNTNKVAVLGDMFELGEFSEEYHRKVGIEVTKNKIDRLYVIGENSKFIAEEAIKKGMPKENIKIFNEKDELEENLKKELKSNNNTILFKASNGMKLFDIVEKLKSF